MSRLVIIGAGGFGREVLAWAQQVKEPLPIKGFLDDNLEALAGFTKNFKILSRLADYQPAGDDLFVCAIGQVEAKRRCVNLIRSRGGRFTQVIHSTTVLGGNVSLGEGVILCPYTILGSDAAVGDFVSINLHSSVAHDARIGNWSQLHCHVDITGGVELGVDVTVGSHASILPGIKVGARAVIGAGSVVMKDVPEGWTAFGVPARPYPRKEPAHAT